MSGATRNLEHFSQRAIPEVQQPVVQTGIEGCKFWQRTSGDLNTKYDRIIHTNSEIDSGGGHERSL